MQGVEKLHATMLVILIKAARDFLNATKTDFSDAKAVAIRDRLSDALSDADYILSKTERGVLKSGIVD